MSALTHDTHALENVFNKKGERVSYAKDQYFIWKNEDYSWVSLIMEGTIRIHFQTTDGTGRTIGYFTPGLVIAKKESFWGTIDRSLSFSADSPIELLRMKRTDFLHELDTNPPFARAYLNQLLQNQIFLLDSMVMHGEKTLTAKCVLWLLQMAKTYGDHDGDRCEIPIPLTQERIAELLYTTRESTSTTLKKLAEENLIHMKNRYINIPSVAELQKYLKNI